MLLSLFRNESPMPSARILIVDDEPDIRSTVKEILEDEGYAVSVAESAAAAREARRGERPDVVLLDIWMPDLDGISLLREWNERGGLPCPIIMMSGHGTIETAIEATRLGAYDFVEKPLSLAKLLLTVERALEASRLRRENEGLRSQLAMLIRSHQPRAVAEGATSAHDAWILSGERGTGKSAGALAAREQRAPARSSPSPRFDCPDHAARARCSATAACSTA
jgi:DNA-binding NtrC family response regulator